MLGGIASHEASRGASPQEQIASRGPPLARFLVFFPLAGLPGGVFGLLMSALADAGKVRVDGLQTHPNVVASVFSTAICPDLRCFPAEFGYVRGEGIEGTQDVLQSGREAAMD